jgi:hypothetical protein
MPEELFPFDFSTFQNRSQADSVHVVIGNEWKSGKVQQSGKDVRPDRPGTGRGTAFDDSGPGNERGNAEAAFVEVPFSGAVGKIGGSYLSIAVRRPV